MALFFPDAGSAALAKNDWGAGTEAAQVRTGYDYEAEARGKGGREGRKEGEWNNVASMS